MAALFPAIVERVQRLRLNDPLGTLTVVVPSRHIEVLLKRTLAESTGIAMNVAFRSLGRFVRELLPPAVAVLDVASAQVLLDGVLSREGILRTPGLEHLTFWLGRSETTHLARDRFEIAGRFAWAFHEYALRRPDLLAAWRRGELRHQFTQAASGEMRGGSYAAMERLEHTLYRLAFDSRGVARFGGSELAGREARELPGPQVGNAPMTAFLPDAIDLAKDTLIVPSEVHFLGIAREFSPEHHRLLLLLAKQCAVHVHVLNPCAEYWEDVRRPSKQKGAVEASNQDTVGDPPLLALWGKAGREQLAALYELAGHDVIETFVPPIGNSLLADVQREIFSRQQGPTHRTADSSLQINKASSLRSEVLAVADAIWRQVASRNSTDENVPLRFHEIAVLVAATEPEGYLAQIENIFEEMFRLPFALDGRALANDSSLAEAANALLVLPTTTLRRDELARALLHPCIVAGVEEDAEVIDTHQWAHWITELSVKGFADASSLDPRAFPVDAVTWDQALRRLSLGVWMAGARSGVEQVFTGGALREDGDDRRRCIPFEIAPSQRASAGAFVHLTRSLLSDIAQCQSKPRALSEWADIFESLLSTYLGRAAERDAGHARALARCIGEVADLRALDVDSHLVPYEVAYGIVHKLLEKLDTRRGRMLTDGVTISTLRAWSPVPIRSLFIIGLGEGSFPQPDSRDPLDLTRIEYRPLDPRSSERDRMRLLEIVTTVQDQITLSYVARDGSSGVSLRPSSAIEELTHTLGLIEQPHEEKETEASFDQWTRRANEVRRLRESVVAHVGRVPKSAEIRGALPNKVAREVFARLDPIEPLVDRDGGYLASRLPDVVQLSFSTLRKFLDCPLQGSARYILGIRDEREEDPLAFAMEALEGERMDRSKILKTAFRETIHLGGAAGERAVLELHEALFVLAELRGEMPTGLLGELEKNRQRTILATWRNHLSRLLGAEFRSLTPYRFGRQEGSLGPSHLSTAQSVGGEVVLPPIELEVELKHRTSTTERTYRKIRVQLSGSVEAANEDLVVAAVTATNISVTHRAHAAFDALVLCAAEQFTQLASSDVHSQGKPLHYVVISSDPQQNPIRSAQTILRPSPEVARQWLRRICGDLLGETHTYLLPIEGAAKYLQAVETRQDNNLVPEIQMLLDRRETVSSQYGPIVRWREVELVDEQRGRRMIHRRLLTAFRTPELNEAVTQRKFWSQ